MTESTKRPVGVAILGMLLIVGGALAILAVIAGYVLGPKDPSRSGVPLELLLSIGILAFAGPGVGRALLKGRTWSWYLATFGFVASAVVGGIGLPSLLRAAELPAAIAAFVGAITITQIVAAAAVAVYLLTGSVVDFFAVERRRRWVSLIVEVAVAAGLFFGASWMVERMNATPAGENVTQLTLLGEQRANSEEDIAFMLERMDNGSMEERVTAAWALGQSGRGDVIEQLLETSREDSDTNVRINAIGAAAVLGGGEIEADLIAFLEDDESEVQAAALRGLANKRFAGAVATVGRFLVDNEAHRVIAVDALGNMESVAAVPFLRQVAGDSDEEVRIRTSYALGKLGDRAAVPTLIEMLDDASWQVRANAAQSLGMLGDPAARSALEGLSGDSNEYVRGAADAALLRLQ